VVQLGERHSLSIVELSAQLVVMVPRWFGWGGRLLRPRQAHHFNDAGLATG